MQLSTYLTIYPCPDQPGQSLVYSTARSAVVQIPDDLLAAAKEGRLDAEDTAALAGLGILVADRSAEQARMLTLFDTPHPATPFSAIVVLNLDCNLACPYCYEESFRGRRYMTTETAALLVETIRAERIGQGQAVRLAFYGGEPLLSMELIRAIATPLQQAARQAGTAFSFSLVTNGTLLNRACVEELLPLGFSGAKITLDGPADLHDQSRPFARGVGSSYEAIARNVLAIHQLVPLQLGGNYTQDNYRRFPEMLDDLLGRGLDPGRVGTVLFAPVIAKADERGLTDFSTGCCCSYEPWLMEAGVWLREETLRRGFPAPKPKLAACMVELERELVIDHEGSYYKCPAFMADPHLRIGSLAAGIGDFRHSHNLELWRNDECLACPYLPICFGGCRQLTLMRDGTMDSPDCRKQYYDTVLERVIRQDLEYQRSS